MAAGWFATIPCYDGPDTGGYGWPSTSRTGGTSTNGSSGWRPALDLRGRGRKTAVIERALDALEAHVERTRPRRADILASIERYVEAGRRLRGRPDTGRPSSLALQDALYDDRGLPR